MQTTAKTHAYLLLLGAILSLAQVGCGRRVKTTENQVEPPRARAGPVAPPLAKRTEDQILPAKRLVQTEEVKLVDSVKYNGVGSAGELRSSADLVFLWARLRIDGVNGQPVGVDLMNVNVVDEITPSTQYPLIGVELWGSEKPAVDHLIRSFFPGGTTAPVIAPLAMTITDRDKDVVMTLFKEQERLRLTIRQFPQHIGMVFAVPRAVGTATLVGVTREPMPLPLGTVAKHHVTPGPAGPDDPGSASER